MTEMLPVVIADASALPATLRDGTQAAFRFAQRKQAESTTAGYKADFALFAAWCAGNGLGSLPALPGAVATYAAIEAERGIRPGTLSRRLAAIRYMHREAGHESPTDNRHVRDVLAGIRNTLGVAPDRKAPATADRLGAMLACIPADTLAGLRDRAMLAVGFAAALRRSELVALVVGDLEEVPEGLRLTVRRSKTDQAGEGRTIAIPSGVRLRPMAAVQAWLAAAQITTGPVFRSINKAGRVSTEPLNGRTVADLVKRYAGAAGFDAAEFSGHSLRAGFVTSAAAAGATVWKMQAVSRHKTLDVLAGYVRDADAFKDHAGAAFL
jgi:site-specific recombinase XerD